MGRPEPALQRGRVGLERADEPVLLEVAGPQLEDQRAHLGQRLALQLAQLPELLAGAGRVAIEQQLDRAGDHRHREERLGDRVVQLPGEVRALLAGRQLAGLAPQLGLQAHLVADVAGRALDAGERAVRRRSGRSPGCRPGSRRPSLPRSVEDGLGRRRWVGAERRPALGRRSAGRTRSSRTENCSPMSSALV